MADAFAGMELDPVTGLYSKKKKPATLPYENPTGTGTTITPLTADATNPNPAPAMPAAPKNFNTADLQQGSANVMGTAQQTALNQGGAPTADKASEMTQKMMTDPNFGWDQAKYKAGQLSAFDLDRANAGRAFKEQFGNVGNSGQVQENLLQTIMQGNIDRSKLENQLDTEALDRSKKNWMDAITAGQDQAKIESDLRAQGIKNLLDVRSGYEGEAGRTAASTENAAQRAFQEQQNSLDRAQAITLKQMDVEGQKAIAELQNKFNTDQLLRQQDFEGTQNALDRAAQKALQAGDIEGQKEIANLQASLTQMRDAKQYEYEALLQNSDQLWKSRERMSDQEFQKSLQALDYGFKDAMQRNDIEAASKLQADRIKAEASERALDRVLEQAKIALEAKQIDSAKVQSEYDRLVQAENSGTVAAGTAMAYLKAQVGDSMAGIEVLDPQSEDALQQAIEADINAKRYSFLQTHLTTNPEYAEKVPVVDASGKPVLDANGNQKMKTQLTQEGLAAFDEWVNKTVYQEAGSSDPAIKAQNQAQKAINDKAYYDTLMKDTSVKDWQADQFYVEDEGMFADDNLRFQAAPPVNTIVRRNGTLYLVMSEPSLNETGGDDHEEIKMRNLSTGAVEVVWPNDDD